MWSAAVVVVVALVGCDEPEECTAATLFIDVDGPCPNATAPDAFVVELDSQGLGAGDARIVATPADGSDAAVHVHFALAGVDVDALAANPRLALTCTAGTDDAEIAVVSVFDDAGLLFAGGREQAADLADQDRLFDVGEERADCAQHGFKLHDVIGRFDDGDVVLDRFGTDAALAGTPMRAVGIRATTSTSFRGLDPEPDNPEEPGFYDHASVEAFAYRRAP